MMALRTSLILAVAFTGAARATDDVVLLQKSSEVNEASMQPSDDLVPDNLQSLFNKMPTQFSMNKSAAEMMKFSQSFLTALHDEHFRRSIYVGLKNFSEILTNFSTKMVSQAQLLMRESANQPIGRAYFLLEHYTLITDDIMGHLAGGAVMLNKNMLDVLPSGDLEATSQPLKELLSSLTHQKVSDYVTSSVLRPKTKRVFDERDTFCSRFMSSMANSSKMDEAIATLTGPGVTQAREMLPMLGSVLLMMAPEIKGDVLALANTTLDVVAKSFRGVNLGYHMMIRAMTEVATSRLNCTLPPNMTLEGFSAAQESHTPLAAVAAVATAASNTFTNAIQQSGAAARGGLVAAFAAALALLSW